MAKVLFLLALVIVANVCDFFRICKDENNQTLDDEHDKLLCEFDGLRSKYKMLKSEFKKFTDVKAASAEKSHHLEIENKQLLSRKGTFPTATVTAHIHLKFSAPANKIPPCNVPSVSSTPYPTFSVLYALSEEGNR
jgi:hypothetical protein